MRSLATKNSFKIGKSRSYFIMLKKTNPDRYKNIKELGEGDIVKGYHMLRDEYFNRLKRALNIIREHISKNGLENVSKEMVEAGFYTNKYNAKYRLSDGVRLGRDRMPKDKELKRWEAIAGYILNKGGKNG